MTLFSPELVIIKVIASALAHAGPTAATDAAMYEETATIAAVPSAGTVGGAATAVGESAYAGIRSLVRWRRRRM
jgi:hypothetical protein